MTMNKIKGNMYGWVSHTWNPIRGKCPHDCSYCYMKRFPVGELRIDEKSLNDNLGKDNFIFVGSSTDMFADDVPNTWIYSVLTRCIKFNNKYLFQTKNPKKMAHFQKYFPKNTILGITLETNKNYDVTNAPSPMERIEKFSKIDGFKKMISIEPILKFDLGTFTYWIADIKPEFVSIGADSKGHKLPEPPKEKVEALIKELKKFTEVRTKDNLKRLI